MYSPYICVLGFNMRKAKMPTVFFVGFFPTKPYNFLTFLVDQYIRIFGVEMYKVFKNTAIYRWVVLSLRTLQYFGCQPKTDRAVGHFKISREEPPKMLLLAARSEKPRSSPTYFRDSTTRRCISPFLCCKDQTAHSF